MPAMRRSGIVAAAARLAAIETPRATIYTRVSSAEQVEGYSLLEQFRVAELEIARRGWRLVPCYADEGRTGTSMRGREGLASLLADAGDECFDVVVVAKLDRLARSLRDATAILAQLEDEHSIPLISVAEQIDPTSPFAAVLRTFMLVLAEQFSANLASEVRKGQRGMWGDSRHVGGAPTGYQVLEPRTRRSRLAPGPDAPLVRRAFELAADGCLSLASMAEQLNEEFGGLSAPRQRQGGRHGHR